MYWPGYPDTGANAPVVTQVQLALGTMGTRSSAGTKARPIYTSREYGPENFTWGRTTALGYVGTRKTAFGHQAISYIIFSCTNATKVPVLA